MSEQSIEELVAKAFDSRAALARGEFCQCEEPKPLGLTCDTCSRRIRAAELRAIIRIVGCHEYVPGLLGGMMCAVCTMERTSPRHNGQASVGVTSWDARVYPNSPSASNESPLSDWTVRP